MTGVVVRLKNAADRTLSGMFPRFFNEKHDHEKDFGFPSEVTFDLAYRKYRRNGLAKAAVDKTIDKTWEDNPWVQDHQRDDGEDAAETSVEADIRARFDDLRVWQHLAEADRRGMVGAYAGVILRLADSQAFDKPVKRVGGGMDGLVEVIPAWEGQLTVSEWDQVETSPTYGQPLMYQFSESAVGQSKNPRQFKLHPDRVLIWSRDGTVNGSSALEAGFNDLITIEKIIGAGGEGFWKNAKSAPVLEVDKEASVTEMAKAMGIKPEDVVEEMNKQVEAFQKGFDQLLMLQGMKANQLQVTLPQPEQFFSVAVQSFCASVSMPMKILVGMQTGERASTEDAQEWAKTNNGRRDNIVVPLIKALVRRLERFGILPKKDWHIEWSDLTEASMPEKIDRAGKMADVNQKMKDTGEFVFLPEEIRATVDLEPLSDADKFRDDPEDEAGALPPERAEAA